MKNSIYLLITFVLLMISCSENSPIERYIIASKTVDCSGVGKQKCMLVKKGDSSKWEYFYSSIEGFNYQEGFEYILDVKEEKVENPPVDGSSIRYILVKEISKIAKESKNLPPVDY